MVLKYVDNNRQLHITILNNIPFEQKNNTSFKYDRKLMIITHKLLFTYLLLHTKTDQKFVVNAIIFMYHLIHIWLCHLFSGTHSQFIQNQDCQCPTFRLFELITENINI